MKHAVNTIWRLLQSFNLHCYDAQWNQNLPYAIVMVLVYPIG